MLYMTKRSLINTNYAILVMGHLWPWERPQIDQVYWNTSARSSLTASATASRSNSISFSNSESGFNSNWSFSSSSTLKLSLFSVISSIMLAIIDEFSTTLSGITERRVRLGSWTYRQYSLISRPWVPDLYLQRKSIQIVYTQFQDSDSNKKSPCHWVLLQHVQLWYF